ncbi:FAD-dependent oxidoreductase [Aerococcus sp. UMB7834]|uniref:FAD-dependent oxidoreductase n=1 Tax=Aerococcus sp. UMB7834 TaxID=3046342 RepID=UPI0025507D2B|nr:FAD-dependent oxidoreductase [Aerococcus sp. UMB7834]MDK6804443.1 FAD-dependent oxidoreductase [Aerococcus sp. UMB7834]
MKIIVVGGVAGGATAIARLRRLDENAEIILLEKGKYVSFANCGLPYYIGGAIAQRDALFVSSKESIEEKYNIDVRTENEATHIDKDRQMLTILDHQTGETYEESYDKLLLSTGSNPFIPPIEGLDHENVFTLWTVPDVDKIDAYIEKAAPKRALVVGGGFIGLEMAENLVDRGLEVTLVEMADQVMPPLDKDMAVLVENHLKEKGIQLVLGEGFEGLTADGKEAKLQSGQTLETDMVLLSIGVRPNSELAKDAGLDLNERGGIRVDEYGQTSDANIYAVGDAVGVRDYVLGNESMVPLAGPANKQGRSVASNILGLEAKAYPGTMGTSVAKVFDLTVASVGANEKTLKKQGWTYEEDYFIALVHPMSHAGYYPGATPMTLKLVFAKDGKVLGAQAVGFEGVDKRIDTIATSIHFKGSVYDLADLELAYAPPYSSAKDPVNFAGYVASNILEGLTDPVRFEEVAAHPDDYTVLDVRENVEQIAGMVGQAKSMPLTQLRNRLDELDKDKQYAVYCAVGVRGYISERILKQNGFKVRNIIGGYRTYQDTQDDESADDQDRKGVSQEEAADQAEEVVDPKPAADQHVEVLDVCGLSCPGPIVQVSSKMEALKDGDILDVTATDPGFAKDIKSWANNTGHTLLDSGSSKGQYTAKLQKNGAKLDPVETSSASPANPVKKEKTMIIFDGDLDKAIASFIIATGAAAMGNQVNMFFTFWGLSILRKEDAPKVEKDFMSRMFSKMMPSSSKKLKLSQMNFGGAGAKMIRGVMDKKGVSSLEELIQQAQDMGVKLTACQMSMDVMGLTKEELIDGVEVGGVASMLEDNDNSNMNLFI